MVVAAAAGALRGPQVTRADSIAVEILDPNLQVDAILSSGISLPLGVVFLGAAHDYLVLERFPATSSE